MRVSTYYGGEPLQRENMATVRHICERAKEMGLTISAVTNGYDLNAYAEILKEFAFRQLQITMDGVGKLNVRRRRHRDGLPTYERILENVALALDDVRYQIVHFHDFLQGEVFSLLAGDPAVLTGESYMRKKVSA